MKAFINADMQKIDNNEYLLVSVRGGSGAIGLKSIVIDDERRVKSTKVFHIGSEALVTVIEPKNANESSYKLIYQNGSRDKCDDKLVNTITQAVENYYLYSQNFSKALKNMFELFEDGLYVVHTAKMIPSDGAGNFFWSAYGMRHEYRGSEDVNSVIGEKKNYSPCFLVPTLSASNYTENKVKLNVEKIKAGKSFGGIAYHIGGMFCALLDGHHAATAAMMNDMEFECIVIEPVRRLLYEDAAVAAQEKRGREVIAFSCPYVKLDLSQISQSYVESFLLHRDLVKDKYYFDVRQKSVKIISQRMRKLLPKDINLKVEQLPDVEMMESAYAVEKLTDEMINALLSGNTELNGKVIINSSYYSSVVTACNYLQYTNFDKFIEFALSIVYNKDLSALHQYVITRLKNVSNPKVRDFFGEMIENKTDMNKPYQQTAELYVKEYDIAEIKRIEQRAEAAIAKLSGELDEVEKNANPRAANFTDKIKAAEDSINKAANGLKEAKNLRRENAG